MGEDPQISVIHLETSTEWRGGQQQIAYLVQGLMQYGIRTHLICRQGAEIARHFKRLDLPLTEITIRNPWDIFAARTIARTVLKQAAKIIHVHSSHALSLGLLVKLFLPKVILVASRRVDFSVSKPIIGALKYRTRLVNCIICVSKNVARVLKGDGIDEHKLRVIYSGLELTQFNPETTDTAAKQELGIPHDNLVIGTVAALVGHKDYPTLLEAAAIVCKKISNVTFCAVGEGPDREKLEEIHGKLGLGRRFLFLGFQSDISRFYALFDVFVLASHKEGLGTAILEAMASGIPVVATDAGGIPEIVEHGSNGLLVPRQDPASLANEIIRLTQDPDLRQRLVAGGLQTVKRFSIEGTVRSHLVLYQELLTGARQ